MTFDKQSNGRRIEVVTIAQRPMCVCVCVCVGYSSRPPSYVVCAGGSSGAPVRRGDVTAGSTAAAASGGHVIYAAGRHAAAPGCCAGDYSCCHTQLRHYHYHHHRRHPHQLYQQQQPPPQLTTGDGDDGSPDVAVDQLGDKTQPAAVCQSSAGDEVVTMCSGTKSRNSETPLDARTDSDTRHTCTPQTLTPLD